MRGKDAPMAQRILNEMTEQKLVPDIATMTTLMNAHLKSRNVAKCWELHKYVTKHGIPLDEVYVSVLMQVYAAVGVGLLRHMTQRRLSNSTGSTLRQQIRNH